MDNLSTQLAKTKLDEYKMHEFMGGKIRQRINDGYFSATDICKASGKSFGHWTELKSTKEFIQIVENDLNKDTNIKISVLEIKVGGNRQGSMIHPLLTTCLAMWISPKFAVNVSKWIEEWKLINNNTTIYNNELCILEPSLSNKQEKTIQLKLAKELNAEIEVETLFGFIDILSIDAIIEIKEFSLWKHALGQILSYATFYPLKKKIIYLFGDIQTDKIKFIKELYEKYEIELIIYKDS